MSWGVQEIVSSRAWEFRRWGLREFGSSGDAAFKKWGVREFEFVSLGVHEMGR